MCKVELQTKLKNLLVVRYGKNDDINAGDIGFKDFYDQYQDELDTIGKRADLLLFPQTTTSLDQDISHYTNNQLSELVPQAVAALEVRSSSYQVKRYRQDIAPTYTKSGKLAKTQKRAFLSFTPKVEDLLGVAKWINTYNVPHFYVQVFFDSIYFISFLDILRLLVQPQNRGSLYYLETNEKNQQKQTLHINLKQGVRIGEIELPNPVAVRKELANGRLLHYVRLEGGTCRLEDSQLQVLLEQTKIAEDKLDAFSNLPYQTNIAALNLDGASERA